MKLPRLELKIKKRTNPTTMNQYKKRVKKENPFNQMIKRVCSWPTRTRTLNVGTKNRCVTNYTIGQYSNAGANLNLYLEPANIF